MTRHKINILLITFLLIFGGIFYCFSRIETKDFHIQENVIYWSEDVEIKFSDYEDIVTPNSELNISHYHAFSLNSNRVEDAFARSYFDKSKSWAKDTMGYDYSKESKIQKIRFDLYEVYARKFNKLIKELRKKKSTTFNDLTRIGDSLFKEINIPLYDIDDPELDRDVIIKKWRPIVDEMLER